MPTTGGDSVSLPPQPTEPVPQKLAKPVPQKDVKHHKQVPQVHKVHQKHTPMPTTGGDKWSMPPQNEGGLPQGPRKSKPVEQVVKPMGGDANGAEQKKVADVQLEVKHAATQVKLEKLAVVKEHKHKQVVNAQMALTEANKLVETAAKRLQKAHQEHIEIQHREVLETFHKHLLEDLKETNNEITDTKNAMSDLELKIKQAKIIKN